MNDSGPLPLPNEKKCCGSSMLPFLLGLLIGGGAVFAGGYTYVQHERAVAQNNLAEAAMNQAGQVMNNMVGGGLKLTPNPFGGATPAEAPAASDADKIKKLGDETVDDLRAGRTLLVYRRLTPELSKKTTLEEFEKANVDTVHVRDLSQLVQLRESKVRKAADAGYQYYCTSGVSTNIGGNVNFAFSFIPADGDWQISDVRVKFTPP